MMGNNWIFGVLFVTCVWPCFLAVQLNLDKYSWQQPHLPNLQPAIEIVEGKAKFYGHVGEALRIDCDLECQIAKGKQPVTLEKIEQEMSYETLDVEKQLRFKIMVNVTDIPAEIVNPKPEEQQQEDDFDLQSNVTRHKRAIFGYDTRFTLSTKKFSTMFPFSTVVKLSTGCAGVKISPKHVLTSAHCIHNGNKYLKGVKRLRVGQFTKKIKKAKKGKGSKKGRKQRKSVKLARSKRNANTKPEYVEKFRWTRAKRTHIPQAWLKDSNHKSENVIVEYDYAVIELKRPLGKQFMKIGISPAKERLPGNRRVHFTAFDRSKSPQLLYRYCGVEEQSNDMIYHYCDAERGTSGAGIYVRLYDQENTTWDRRVIGVYSGHQWVRNEEGAKEYNTGVRITPLKFAQICFWTTGDYAQCRGDQ